MKRQAGKLIGFDNVHREPIYQSSRLSKGEFTASPRELERKEFLRAIFEVEPGSRTLLDDALTLLELPNSPFVWNEYLASMVKSASAWVKRWHLLDEWCVEAAVDFCSLGYEVDLLPQRAPCAFRFEPRTWNSNARSRADFEAQECAHYKQALRAYCDEVERDARSRGLTKTPEKRNPNHYRWLARYQVKGESPAEIWHSLQNGSKVSRRAVEIAIHATARDIRLTWRPPAMRK